MTGLFARELADWSGRRYLALRRLGGGTNGRVMLARHDRFGGLVAIRYLPAQLLVDRERAAAFRADLATLRRLRSRRVARLRRYAEDPRVARLHRHVPAGDGAAIVTEAVDGVPLNRTVRRGRTMPVLAALAVFRQSLLGLAAVHAVGLVYRDFKPSRLVVDASGAAKLIDVGVGVLSRDGGPPGTSAYRAPELWRGRPASAAADVYAATCVFFECVVGARPYPATELFSLMGGHTTRPVPMSGVPEPLRPLILGGMAKDPADRPGAAALAAQLDATAAWAFGQRWKTAGMAELAAVVRPLRTPFPPTTRIRAAGRMAVAVVVVALVAAAATAVIVLRPADRPPDEATEGRSRPSAAQLPAASPPTSTPPPAPTTPAAPPVKVTVLATADIYAARRSAVPELPGGGGTLPRAIAVGSTTEFTFAASGTLFCGGNDMTDTPDGGTCAGGATNLTSNGSISGIAHDQATQFLVGVFTADQPTGKAPASLNFSTDAKGTNFHDLSPRLNQTFFIGDGQADDGTRQRFKPPAGATYLSLGFADGWIFQGPPGFYDDNSGSITVTVIRAAGTGS